MSEYLGIRLSMLDALQQYYKTPGLETMTPEAKQDILKKGVKEACERNNLLGDRKEIIGEAWEKLIGSRDAKAVEKFVNDPDIKAMATSKEFTEKGKDGKILEIKDKVKTMGNTGAVIFMSSNGLTLRPMVTSFEDIAQKTGMINYKGLDTEGKPHKEKEETLSGLIDGFAKEAAKAKAKAIPERGEENGSLSKIIKNTFDNRNGKVEDKFLHGDHPSKTPAPAQSHPKPTPGNAVNSVAPAPTPARQVER